MKVIGLKGAWVMREHHVLVAVWLVLLALTLLTAAIAESVTPVLWTILFVTLTVSFKGQLIVDRLMGLRYANPAIRYSMLSYFYLLPVLIIWAMVFPEQLASLTTL